ncbi:MAG: thioredoxin domain-containing protein [Patescibacteria group bacterium]
MNDQMNNDLVNGTRRTSFFLGLMCGIAGMSTFALVGFFALAFSGQGINLAKENGNNNTNAVVNVNQPVANEPTEVSYTPVPAVTSDDHVKGSANAKVTLIEYSDFECPYCANHKKTTDQIMENYGDKVRVVFRHYPLSFHANAQKAAEASECAAEQGKFWEMYDKIFAANEAGTMGVDKWKAEAKNLGLNTKKFNECLDSGKYASKIAAEEEEGLAAGVEGTPATFVNGELVSGAVPYEQFKQIIDSYL